MTVPFSETCLDGLKDLGVTLAFDSPLAGWTTFRLGGKCPCLLTCQTPLQLETSVKKLLEEKISFILIGGGSNLVVSDQGVECFVVRYLSPTPIIQYQETEIEVSGSTLLDHLALQVAQKGLEGLNYTSGIPGAVGGAVVGNAGAFGKQVGDYLKSVALLSLTGEKKTVGRDQLEFQYRHSNLKETGDIVLSARFALAHGNRDALLQERADILALRHAKHPDLATHPCAGSFFRNVEPTSKAERRQAAGYFLEEAGAKNFHVGGARIFEKHANIIVKSENGTAQNVHDLSRKMAEAVKAKFGLELVREVRFVGKFERENAQNRNHVIW